jgi:hypothetical protein
VPGPHGSRVEADAPLRNLQQQILGLGGLKSCAAPKEGASA